MEHRGSISIPYEISIPKSDIPLRSCLDNNTDDYSPYDQGDPAPSRSGLYDAPGRTDATSASRFSSSHRSAFSLLSPPDATSTAAAATNSTSAGFSYDTESGFESNASAAASLGSWRSQTYGPPLLDDNLPDLRNVTVRNTLRNRPAASPTAVEPCVRGKTSPLAPGDFGGGGGSDDEAATWRAYRARSILDADEAGNGKTGAGCGAAAAKGGAKATPAEVRRDNASRQI